ncbi:MAG: SirB2 family protein [Bacteroidia bacterium]|nr:SirB2 family protein [Bacteroidia bacterium]MCZ2278049.1 SirB2 family protein [Bacteroidia bacterium]
MFTGMLHTHSLSVILFVVLFLVKTILLLANADSALASFTKRTQLADRIISVAFLLTGIYLTIYSGLIGAWFWVKIIVLICVIPLSIVAFKKKNKILVVLSLMMLVYIYGISEMKSPVFKKEIKGELAGKSGIELGQTIFENNCASCHGMDGKRMLSGAKDLTKSQLTAEEQIRVIRNGKNSMMAYKKLLTEEQIQAVAGYVQNMKH